MKTLFTLLLSIFSFAATAQAPHPAVLSLEGIWGNGYNGTSPLVTKTYDGGFIIGVGTHSTPGSGDIDSFCSMPGNRGIFLKYDMNASLQWTKCFVPTGDTSFGVLIPTPDSGYVVGGSVGSSGIYVSKHDASDNIIWSRKYSEGYSATPSSMIATNDGGYILACATYYVDTNFTLHHGSWMTEDIGVLKLDSLGNKMWSTVIGGSEDDGGSIFENSDGYYIVGITTSDDYDCTGNHGGTTGSRDVYIVRMDKNGHIIWHRDIGGSGDDFGGSVIPDGKGGIIVGASCGSFDGDVTHKINYHGTNMWVFDIDSNSNILWQNCYGGGGGEHNYSICKATEGSLWFAGENVDETRDSFEVDTFYGGNDAWFVHADSVGNYISSVVMGSDKDDIGYFLFPLANGLVMAGGNYGTNNGSFSALSSSSTLSVFLVEFEPWSTGIKQLNFGKPVEIYPNPARDAAFVKLTQQLTGNTNIIVMDITGRQIYSNTYYYRGENINIPIGDWAKGMYYVQVVDKNGYRTVQKLIRE